MLQDLQGKIALVTGATSGIGMETAAALAGARACTGSSAAGSKLLYKAARVQRCHSTVQWGGLMGAWGAGRKRSTLPWHHLLARLSVHQH